MRFQSQLIHAITFGYGTGFEIVTNDYSLFHQGHFYPYCWKLFTFHHLCSYSSKMICYCRRWVENHRRKLARSLFRWIARHKTSYLLRYSSVFKRVTKLIQHVCNIYPTSGSVLFLITILIFSPSTTAVMSVFSCSS